MAIVCDGLMSSFGGNGCLLWMFAWLVSWWWLVMGWLVVAEFVIEGRGKGQLVRWVSSGLSCLWAKLPLGEKTGLLMCFSTCVIPSFHFWSGILQKLSSFKIKIKMYKHYFLFHYVGFTQNNMTRTPTYLTIPRSKWPSDWSQSLPIEIVPVWI